MAILQWSTYCSLLRVNLKDVYATTRLILWPLMVWSIVTLHGAERQLESINYRNCHVPRSLYMRRYTGVNINYMMFHTMPHPLSNYDRNIMSSCSAANYVIVLRRSKVSNFFYTVFGYSTVKERANETKDFYQGGIAKLK